MPHAVPRPALTEHQATHFWTHVKKRGPNECWEYVGARYSGGYGVVGNIGSSGTGAHRVAFFLTFGWWPPVVMHVVCDNPPCCNPLHLQAAQSNAENMRDASRKGRIGGEVNGQSKLTNEQVQEIRRLYGTPRNGRPAPNGIFQRELAARYGVCRELISYIVNRHTWKHI